MQRGTWALGLLLALSFVGAAGWAAPLRVEIQGDSVVASGLSPQGKVVLMGVTREIGEDDFPTVRRHLQILGDEDGDGTVRYSLGTRIPARSVWVVADLASGEAEVVSPEEIGLRRADWRGRGPGRRGDGRDSVEDRRSILELLVVRPRVGAWTLRVTDGDESDGDGAIDGRLEGILEQLQPLVGDEKPPAVFQRDDVVIGIDPAALEVVLVKVSR